MNEHIEKMKREHLKFWNRERLGKPFAAFRIGDFFFSSHYQAAAHLLEPGKKITPEMLVVDDFLEDYERHYVNLQRFNRGAFWTAEPFTGIPWMEAFWGCEVIGQAKSFISEAFVKDPKALDKLVFSPENPWVEKYFEFVGKITKASGGRFPVGQPIMRGPSDVAGAILGQSEFVIALYEEPELMHRFLDRITDSFMAIVKRMQETSGEFEGGHSMGFYHLWSPKKCIWFQEDLCALLSPDLYRSFLLGPERKICAPYDYTLVHLHPTSFYILDDLLTNERLRVVEINKDVGGPSIKDMLPAFRKVLDRKRNLLIWGDLLEDELKLIFDNLPNEGIFFNIVEPDVPTAERIVNFIEKMKLD